jgi:hypothetical protein
MTRTFVAFIALALVPAAAAAGPREEALRLAPADAALVLVVQNAHDHLTAVAGSPFGVWFSTTNVGKQLLGSTDLLSAKESLEKVARELMADTPPGVVFADVLGGAVVFAYTPAPPTDPVAERSVLLIRPRKAETLLKLVGRLNTLQTAGGEVKAVVRREHAGQEYFERQKAAGAAEFYCFLGDVLVFSAVESEVRATVDRARSAPTDKPPPWVERLTKLGVSGAAAVLAVSPRAFDAELDAKASAARGGERAFLTKFREVWSALDAAAAYLDLGHDLELGVAARFRPDALPPAFRGWLTGSRATSALWAAVPENALVAVAGRITAAELVDALDSFIPQKKPVRTGLDQALGPVVGRDKLGGLLNSLGPDWAIWAEPPGTGGGSLPMITAAVRVRTDDAPKTAAQVLDWAFLMARVGYNAGHEDQIELREEVHDRVTIKSLANDKGFPPGFRPSFAVKGGFLLVATSPDAIKGFRPPAGVPADGAEVPVARFSAAAARAYLSAHGEELARLLAGAGMGDATVIRTHLNQFGDVLELVDRADVLSRGDETGLRVWVRVKFAKPLKK